MLEINDSTSAIQEAITIIDQIAFPNILSLKCEQLKQQLLVKQGKDFAVVAAEVWEIRKESGDGFIRFLDDRTPINLDYTK